MKMCIYVKTAPGKINVTLVVPFQKMRNVKMFFSVKFQINATTCFSCYRKANQFVPRLSKKKINSLMLKVSKWSVTQKSCSQC